MKSWPPISEVPAHREHSPRWEGAGRDGSLGGMATLSELSLSPGVTLSTGGSDVPGLYFGGPVLHGLLPSMSDLCGLPYPQCWPLLKHCLLSQGQGMPSGYSYSCMWESGWDPHGAARAWAWILIILVSPAPVTGPTTW